MTTLIHCKCIFLSLYSYTVCIRFYYIYKIYLQNNTIRSTETPVSFKMGIICFKEESVLMQPAMIS